MFPPLILEYRNRTGWTLLCSRCEVDGWMALVRGGTGLSWLAPGPRLSAIE